MTNLCLLAGGIAGWWASIEDAMAEAGVNTLIGISVVFLALLFICFIMRKCLFQKSVRLFI